MTFRDDVTYVVTIRLLVGDRPAANFYSRPVTSSQEAIQAISVGETVRLPSGAWSTAGEVLRFFGLNDDEIADRIHFAQTGKILRSL